MIYDFARPLIGVFFMIAVVNLLVISESYKKIITFYMHFLIIIIILNPVIRIMNNEVGSFIDSLTFISEESFQESINYYQRMMDNDLQEHAFSEIETRVSEAANICGAQLTNVDVGEKITIRMTDNSVANQNCMIVEIGVSRDEVVFERGGR